MRIRWFVLGAVMLVVFPAATVGFAQGLAQSLISGADSVVDAPAGSGISAGGDSIGR